MIIIDRNDFGFISRQILFSENLFDVDHVSSVKFSGCKKKIVFPNFSCSEYTTSVIDLSQNIDAIWQKMKKKSCRYAINKSERDGVIIVKNQNFKDFYDIYSDALKHHDREKIRQKFQTIEQYGTLFTAHYDGEILGGHIYLEDNNVILYWLSANTRAKTPELRSIIGNASHALHWEAIKYAKLKGIVEFDMGGLFAGTAETKKEESIDSFKESFGGERQLRYSYHRDYSHIFKLGKRIYRIFNKYKFK
jgi:lipid II:glycine glycyltransferase (peptidoglycan interpeptide bridge formation enzyme)